MQLEAELRQRICAMRDEERSKLIGAALKSGDQTVLAAVLRGHHALVGMSEAQHTVYREQWRQSQFPQETDRIARLKKAIDATDRAGQCLVGMVESAVKNPVAIAAEQNAEEGGGRDGSGVRRHGQTETDQVAATRLRSLPRL